MKEQATKQHKTTLGVIDGFKIFWGFILGILSLALVLLIPSIIFLIFMYIAGTV